MAKKKKENDPLRLCGLSKSERHKYIHPDDPAIDWEKTKVKRSTYLEFRDAQQLVFFKGATPAVYMLRPIDERERSIAGSMAPMINGKVPTAGYIYELMRLAITDASGVVDRLGKPVKLEWISIDNLGDLVTEETVAQVPSKVSWDIAEILDRIQDLPAVIQKKLES